MTSKLRVNRVACELNPSKAVPSGDVCVCTCQNVVTGTGNVHLRRFFPPRHPLFPLLALLFEKCEQSTQGSEGTTSASFDVDIENFVRKQEKEGKPFFCEDPETDNLVSKIMFYFLFFISSELKSCSVNFKLLVRTSAVLARPFVLLPKGRLALVTRSPASPRV